MSLLKELGALSGKRLGADGIGMGQWKKDLLVLLSESLHSINNNRQTTVVALRGIDFNVAVSTKACYQLNPEEGESVLFEI